MPRFILKMPLDRTIVVLFAVEIALLLVLDGRHVDANVRGRVDGPRPRGSATLGR